jgi:hypothetical protein
LIHDTRDSYTTRVVKVLKSINSINIYSNNIIKRNEGSSDATDEYHLSGTVYTTNKHNTILTISEQGAHYTNWAKHVPGPHYTIGTILTIRLKF